jgi:hypothetical protein
VSWARIDDQYPEHPKVVAGGPAAMNLQVHAICYCSRYLTDGLIPKTFAKQKAKQVLEQMLEQVLSMCSSAFGASTENLDPDSLIKKMVECGLWEKTDKGFIVHDYLVYNPSKAQVIEGRQKRSEAGRKGGLVSKANAQANASGLLDVCSEHLPSKSQPPTPSPSPNKKEKTSPPDGGSDSSAADDSKNSGEKAEETKPNSEFRRITDYFNAVYERNFGEPYLFQRAKDGKAVKDLLKTLSFDELRNVIDQYFETDDKWINEQGREWNKLPGQINRLKQLSSGRIVNGGNGKKPIKTSPPQSSEDHEKSVRDNPNGW